MNTIVKCNNCHKVFLEKNVVHDGEENQDYCPHCEEAGVFCRLDDISQWLQDNGFEDASKAIDCYYDL